MNVALLCNEIGSFDMLLEYAKYEKIMITIHDTYNSILENHKDIDVILVDEKNKDHDVYNVCEILNNRLDKPIIMLSAEDSVSLEKLAFDVGCVDYVKMPYVFSILLRRLHVHHKGTKKSNKLNGKISIGDDVVLNLDYKSVFIGSDTVKLTPKQFKILCYLVENSNKIVTRQELFANIWPKQIKSKRIIDTHIKNIRKMIPQIQIDTINGSGYRYMNKDIN